jgi:hypothetical protein
VSSARDSPSNALARWGNAETLSSAGMLRVESKFRRLFGHRAMTALIKALEVTVRGGPTGSERKVA